MTYLAEKKHRGRGHSFKRAQRYSKEIKSQIHFDFKQAHWHVLSKKLDTTFSRPSTLSHPVKLNKQVTPEIQVPKN